jgi:DinB superfamily
MDIKQAIVASLNQSDFIVDAYLADLTPQELLARPCGGANHIAWQLGHLIASEHYLADKAVPGRLDSLPAGFAERHKKETAGNNNPGDFLSKEEYQRVRKQVRGQILRIVDSLSPADFDRPVSGGLPPFVKTTGETLLFLGPHWIMHAGQWAVTRRSLGRAPLF